MNQAINQFTETGQASWAALQALWKIQAGFLQKATALQYSLAALGVEGGVRQWQLLNSLAERDGLIADQKEFAETYSTRIEEIGREAALAMRAAGDDVTAWLLGSFATTVKPAARAKPKQPARRSSRKKPG